MKVLWTAAMALLPMGLQAQKVPSDIREIPTVESALAGVRGGVASAAIGYLTQEGIARTPRELSALVDSLVVVAVKSQKDGAESDRLAARAAVAALATSALDGHVASRAAFLSQRGVDVHPVVFSGAFDALERIYHSAGDVAVRGAILSSVARISIGRVTAFLVNVATDPAPPDRASAAEAVRLLAAEDLPGGVDALRRLYRTGAVSEPSAVEILNAIAANRGWPGAPGGLGSHH